MRKMLLDINVWVALAFECHLHHVAARNWFDEIGDEDLCLFCRLTQQGFLRLATNAKALGEDALSMTDAWTAFDAFIADGRIELIGEPANVEGCWRRFTNRASRSTDAWSDAWLAAFAVSADVEFVTFDRGFSQYSGLRAQILSEVE
ncbi:MAG: TA system VapC family ribonuclease toxin [Planctomycetaceae bacterium]